MEAGWITSITHSQRPNTPIRSVMTNISATSKSAIATKNIERHALLYLETRSGYVDE